MADKKWRPGENIPAPTVEQRRAYQNDPQTYVLVYDPNNKRWVLTQRKQRKENKLIGPEFVTIESYDGGQKVVPGKEQPENVPGGSTAKVTDTKIVENEIASTTITMTPSGPVVTRSFPNPANPKAEPSVEKSYLYVAGPAYEGSSLASKTFTFNRTDTARDQHLKDLYKIFGSKQAIIDRLYEAGYLPDKKDIPTDLMISALDNALGTYTVDQVEAYQAKTITEFSTFADWLKGRKGQGPESLAGTRTVPQITEYSDTDARAVIDEIASELLQRLPSEQEYAKLVPLLQKKQRKNPAMVTTTTDEKGRTIASKTKTGINERQFLIEKLSKRDEAKANQLMAYYDAFRQAIGVR